MLSAMQRFLPAGVDFDPPHGGLFIWLQLLENLCSTKLRSFAWEEGVDFAPGNGFFIDQTGGDNWLRLNFVAQSPDQIEEGIKRLGSALRRSMAAP